MKTPFLFRILHKGFSQSGFGTFALVRTISFGCIGISIHIWNINISVWIYIRDNKFSICSIIGKIIKDKVATPHSDHNQIKIVPVLPEEMSYWSCSGSLYPAEGRFIYLSFEGALRRRVIVIVKRV